MPFLSFRKYLYLETGRLYPVADPFTNPGFLPVKPEPKILEEWRVYRSRGTRPFYADKNYAERLISVLDKTLYFDIPFFVPSITDNNLRLMKTVSTTLAEATIPLWLLGMGW